VSDTSRLHAARPFRGISLNVKLILFSSLLTASVVLAAFLGLHLAIRNHTRQVVTEQLTAQQRVHLDLQHQTLTQLLATSQLITQSPTLRAAMETYRVESSIGSARSELLATIEREIVRIAGGLDKDLLVVTDDRGRTLASWERTDDAPVTGVDFSTVPAVRHALNPMASIDRSNYAVIAVRGTHFQVGVVPIVLQGFTIGALGLGVRIDETFASAQREIFSGDLILTVADSIVLTTLKRVVPGTDGKELADATGPDGVPRAVRLAGEEFVIAPLPLGRDAAGEPVTLYLIQSVTGLLNPLNRDFVTKLLGYGSIAVVLAGVGAGWVARSVLGPFQRFVSFVSAVAATGKFSQRFDTSDSTPEIESLNDSYNQLIDSLAREHTQLELRTAELSTANQGLREQITERQRIEQALRDSEEQLRQSQKLEAVGTLAGGVAHDFNNLLTVISSYSELALEGLEGTDPLRGDVEEIRNASRRAALLTTQLLAFSRKQVLHPKVIDLNEVVAAVEKMLRRLIREDIVLDTVKRVPLPPVKADPGQIEQVIINLAVNSRDAMPDGGTLIIETKSVVLDWEYARRHRPAIPGPYVMLAVSDTGTGMDRETQARIFEPFFTTKEAGKGTGLGLSTVYGIVKQSGGFVWVYSELGRGTSFKIYLPEVTERAGRDEGSTEPEEAPQGTETVLVVEDDDAVRDLAVRCLMKYGYHVLPAGDGEEALETSSGHEGAIDLLLTDVVMPRMNGKELASRLRARRPQTRVLYMSGYTDEAVIHHGVLEPGTLFLQKPFNPADLARRVREVLSSRAETVS
jgi:signal transduction histidine kinase/ActR/RegA family two-component response regulator